MFDGIPAKTLPNQEAPESQAINERIWAIIYRGVKEINDLSKSGDNTFSKGTERGNARRFKNEFNVQFRNPSDRPNFSDPQAFNDFWTAFERLIATKLLSQDRKQLTTWHSEVKRIVEEIKSKCSAVITKSRDRLTETLS